jgi:hypothetical protein
VPDRQSVSPQTTTATADPRSVRFIIRLQFQNMIM